MTDPEGTVTTYSYDSLNRLTGLGNSWAGTFGFTYDPLSRRTSLTRPNGVNTTYGYDTLSHLLSVVHQASGATLDGATYTYDLAGNRTSKTDLYANVTSNFSYDNIYQLTGVTQGSSTTESYTYDAVGNRLSSLGVSPYSYNSSNELTSTPSGSYTYDKNGNMLTRPDGAQFTWDYSNRLTKVVLPNGGGTVTFQYDPFGRRIQKAGPLGTTNYLYDGTNIIAEVDSAGNILARFALGPLIDEPLSQFRSGATTYYQAEGSGSITSMADSSATIAATYSYDSYGNLSASTGTIVNPYRYTSREFDAETGIYYYRARFFDPSNGRFLSEDPKKTTAEFNFYRYALNSPLNRMDPLGWASCPSGHCSDCPGGRWISGAVTAEAYASARFIGGGGLLFAGVMICTSNPTFNVPFTTLCGFGSAGLSEPPPLTGPPAEPIGIGGGLGGAAFSCTGIHCKEDLGGREGGWFAQVGPAYYFREGVSGGGGCQGAGVGFELGLGGGGFKCKTWTGPSIGGVK